jgi:hypothetical protein
MAMNAKDREFRNDPTEGERRKNLSEEQIKDLELAGGVEGGMQAGSAGGPGGDDARVGAEGAPGKSGGGPKPAKERPKR